MLLYPGKIPEGTTYTQTISPSSTGGYVIQGSTSNGVTYTATISYQTNAEMGTSYGQGGGYSLEVTYTDPSGQSTTTSASIPSVELDPEEIAANIDPEPEILYNSVVQ